MTNSTDPLKVLLPALLLLSVVTGCSSSAEQTSEPSLVSQASSEVFSPVGAASSPSAPQPQTDTFQFPQPTCGDQPTGENDTWYPIFINGGDVAQIRAQFCDDSILTTRKDSGIRSVQVASFTNRQRADAFAQAVSGEVGSPTTATDLKEAAGLQASPKPHESISTQSIEVGFRHSRVLISKVPGSSIRIRDDANAQAYVRHLDMQGMLLLSKVKSKVTMGRVGTESLLSQKLKGGYVVILFFSIQLKSEVNLAQSYLFRIQRRITLPHPDPQAVQVAALAQMILTVEGIVVVVGHLVFAEEGGVSFKGIQLILNSSPLGSSKASLLLVALGCS